MVLFLNEIQQEESVILFRTLLAKLQGIFMDIESSNKSGTCILHLLLKFG